MFRFAPFVIRFVFALLLIGGLVMGGAALFRSGMARGYVEGYNQGLAENPQIEDGQTAPQRVAPYAPFYGPGYGYGMRYYGHFGPHFGFPFLGLFCLFGLLPLFFFGMFRPWGMRRHWGHHGPWGQHPGSCPGQPPASAEAPKPTDPEPPAAG